MQTGLILTAFSLGVVYSAAPGAVNTEALRRGLARGFRPALLVQFGAVLGDLIWATLAFAGVTFLVQVRPLQVALGVAGACFLLRLAWLALQQAWRGESPAAQGSTARGDFTTGIVFSLANPFGLVFWSGIGGGLGATGIADPAMSDFALFLAGFAFGAAAWCVGAASLIGWGRRFIGAGAFRWVSALSGLALGYFGARLLWETVSDVLEQPSATVIRVRRFVTGLRQQRLHTPTSGGS
jgi:chemosensory pili system protein ChpE